MKQKHWQRIKNIHDMSWMESIKIRLFNSNFKKALNNKVIISAINFSNYQRNKNRGQE